jgi:hypothetical protein
MRKVYRAAPSASIQKNLRLKFTDSISIQAAALKPGRSSI